MDLAYKALALNPLKNWPYCLDVLILRLVLSFSIYLIGLFHFHISSIKLLLRKKIRLAKINLIPEYAYHGVTVQYFTVSKLIVKQKKNEFWNWNSMKCKAQKIKI